MISVNRCVFLQLTEQENFQSYSNIGDRHSCDSASRASPHERLPARLSCELDPGVGDVRL